MYIFTLFTHNLHLVQFVRLGVREFYLSLTQVDALVKGVLLEFADKVLTLARVHQTDCPIKHCSTSLHLSYCSSLPCSRDLHNSPVSWALTSPPLLQVKKLKLREMNLPNTTEMVKEAGGGEWGQSQKTGLSGIFVILSLFFMMKEYGFPLPQCFFYTN